MARCGKSHLELTNGKGRCSVPMWSNGMPAGFCDNDAFGKPSMNGRYEGYVPGLACFAHGGPKCPGIEVEPSVYSGCNQSGEDCPVCGK